jgi:leucyl aminopeptidase (aminopeptidase T)
VQRSFEDNLALYAQLAIREGVTLSPGQELIISAETGDAHFVRLLVAEAYRVGAKNVEVLWNDPQVTLTRFREGSDEAMAYTPKWLYDGITRAFRERGTAWDCKRGSRLAQGSCARAGGDQQPGAVCSQERDERADYRVRF